MRPIPNGFRDKAISLYSSKIVDKKKILRTVSNTGVYCSSDKVGMLCRIWSFHGDDYEECRLLGCGAVWTDVSEERRFTKDLHDATSQKTAFFKVATVCLV
jgi:hypothetical protein